MHYLNFNLLMIPVKATVGTFAGLELLCVLEGRAPAVLCPVLPDGGCRLPVLVSVAYGQLLGLLRADAFPQGGVEPSRAELDPGLLLTWPAPMGARAGRRGSALGRVSEPSVIRAVASVSQVKLETMSSGLFCLWLGD